MAVLELLPGLLHVLSLDVLALVTLKTALGAFYRCKLVHC